MGFAINASAPVMRTQNLIKHAVAPGAAAVRRAAPAPVGFQRWVTDSDR